MRETISQRELRNDSAAVLRRVEAGESLTVTRHGHAVADLVPHRPHQRGRRWLPTDEFLDATRDLPSWRGEDFARELEDLDPLIEEDQVDPWH